MWCDPVMGRTLQGGGQTSTSYIPMMVAPHLGDNIRHPTWMLFIMAKPIG